MPTKTILDHTPHALWNGPLKNGSSSDMAVDGSGTPVEFSIVNEGDDDYELRSLCLIAEFLGSLAIGPKFLKDSISTLANGLLLEAKLNDEVITFGNFKVTHDLVEVSTPQGGLNIISGTNTLIQIFFYIPEHTQARAHGTFATDDYIKATVRDDLSDIWFLECFAQGLKLTP